jgi:DNA repair ATPase RecN
MAEEKKEPWLNYLALVTVLLAVCATLSTFKGGNFSTRSVLAQSRASDQWAYYQSKSIKGYIYEVQRDKLELELREKRLKLPQAVIGDYEQKINWYSEKIKKYEDEKAGIEKEARHEESVRDEAQKHSQEFGMAVIFLQIAILLSSIAALLKKKAVWIVGLFSGAVGMFYFVNGFMLIAK